MLSLIDERDGKKTKAKRWWEIWQSFVVMDKKLHTTAVWQYVGGDEYMFNFLFAIELQFGHDE